MACGVLWSQVNEIQRAMRALKPVISVPGVQDAYNFLYKQQGALMAKIGVKFPRTITQILKLAGLSPGTVTLYHDVEGGWLVDARETLGALPVYHYVDDTTAIAILSGQLTHELEKILMTPDDYQGE